MATRRLVEDTERFYRALRIGVKRATVMAMTITEPAALSPDYRPRPLASLLCDLLPTAASSKSWQ